MLVTYFGHKFMGAVQLSAARCLTENFYKLRSARALAAVMMTLVMLATSNAADSPNKLTAIQRSSSPTISSSPAVCYASRENVTEVKPVVTSFERKTRDRSCHISVASMQKELLTGRAAIVDVRHPDAFNRYSIPASLNIPLYAIKTKAFLKDKHVILINEGASATSLEGACVDLHRAGFSKVSVLEGGLHAWAGQQGTVVGDVLAVDQLKWMSPQDLFAERQYDDWIVFDFSAKQESAMRPWLPKKLEAIKLNAKTAATVKTAMAGKGGNSPRKILIVDEKGVGYSKIEPLMRKAGLNQIYYLEGGLAGYRQFITQQTAMWNQKDKPLKLPACQS